MAASDELTRLLARAGVTPYRRVGKVLVMYDPATPNDTVQAAIEAVKRFSSALVDEWGAPTGDMVSEWRIPDNMAIVEVCDDPCPRDVDPAMCPIAWLVGRASRYHFRFLVSATGELQMDGLPSEDGNGKWKAKNVRKLLPQWFMDACRDRRDEIASHISARRESETAPPDPEPERCPECGRDVSDQEDRVRLRGANPFCDRGGARAVTDRVAGKIIRLAIPRCPYKDAA
jgi:hypothetical protein